MRRLCSALLLSFAAMPAAAEPVYSPRVFDVVAPEGGAVEMIDGQSVLRQRGAAYGAVLTFLPESDTQAWIPVAVLNTGSGDLTVGTGGVSARYGETALKVWSTTALVRWRKDGRAGLPPAPDLPATPSAAATQGGLLSMHTNASPLAPTPPPTIGPVQPGTQTQTGPSGSVPGNINSRSNDEQRAMDERRHELDALRDRLFREEKIPPRGVGRGDVLIALPPRRSGAAPAEFVLTLEFGGERMDVRYRERMPPADAVAR